MNRSCSLVFIDKVLNSLLFVSWYENMHSAESDNFCMTGYRNLQQRQNAATVMQHQPAAPAARRPSGGAVNQQITKDPVVKRYLKPEYR